MRLALLEKIPEALKPKTIFDEVNINKERFPKETIEHVDIFKQSEEENYTKTQEKEEKVTIFDDFDDDTNTENKVVKEVEIKAEPIIEKEVKATTRKESPIKPLAQLNKTYIIGEDYTGEGGFYLIDQHAAMERINYEYFSKLYSENITTMMPLIPTILNLKPSDAKLLTEEKLNLLKCVGVELEPFGLNAYKVVTVPTWIQRDNEKEYVDDLVNMALHEDKVDIFRLRKHAIATMACKASLKANMNCTMEEAKVMLDRLYNCENPHNCPHGRPIIIKFSKYEIEKLFKRTGV